MTVSIMGSAIPKPSQIRHGEISVIIATRGRPEMLAEVLVSLNTRKDKVALWLYVDDDDQVTREALAQGDFSDIYNVFQEERHTDLTPEERQVFDAKYFRQEALAVASLIA